MRRFSLPFFRNLKSAGRSGRSRHSRGAIPPGSIRGVGVAGTLVVLTVTDRRCKVFPTSVTVDAGAPLMLALTGAGGSSSSFSFAIATSSRPAGLTATVMPSTNRTVQITAHTTTNTAGTTVGTSGVMDFMLFDNYVSSATNYFANLVTSGFYNSAAERPLGPRREADHLPRQRRRPPDGQHEQHAQQQRRRAHERRRRLQPQPCLHQCRHPGDGQVTGNNGNLINDSNNSQFFITNKVERAWDFRYTILGVMTEGDALRQAIAAVPTTKNTDVGLAASPTIPWSSTT